MTKKEMFTALLSIVDGSSAENKADLIDGLNHEIELLDKKSMTPRKPTATQLENETFKTAIVDYLTRVNMPKTIKEMQSEIVGFAELSNQRISHLLTDLRKAGIVARTYVKKVAFFALGKEEVVEA